MAVNLTMIDIELIRGDDFKSLYQLLSVSSGQNLQHPTQILTEPTVIDGVTYTPVDVRGVVITSHIRKSTAFLEALQCPFTVTVVDPVLGLYELSLTNQQTTSLSTNDSVKYRYDVQVQLADDLIRTYVAGAVTIILDVTR